MQIILNKGRLKYVRNGRAFRCLMAECEDSLLRSVGRLRSRCFATQSSNALGAGLERAQAESVIPTEVEGSRVVCGAQARVWRPTPELKFMHSSEHAPRGRVAIPPLRQPAVGMTDRALPEKRRQRGSFSERAHVPQFQIFLGST